jgi:hypothetical protein
MCLIGLKDPKDPRLVAGIAIVRINVRRYKQLKKTWIAGVPLIAHSASILRLLPQALAHDDALQPHPNRRIHNGSTKRLATVQITITRLNLHSIC